MSDRIERPLRTLAEGGVRFVVVGGLAAAAHGAARATHDVDVVYERTRENLERLAASRSRGQQGDRRTSRRSPSWSC